MASLITGGGQRSFHFKRNIVFVGAERPYLKTMRKSHVKEEEPCEGNPKEAKIQKEAQLHQKIQVLQMKNKALLRSYQEVQDNKKWAWLAVQNEDWAEQEVEQKRAEQGIQGLQRGSCTMDLTITIKRFNVAKKEARTVKMQPAMCRPDAGLLHYRTFGKGPGLRSAIQSKDSMGGSSLVCTAFTDLREYLRWKRDGEL
ncbi:hypothetical protein AAFF_G00240700 [Aldrovandia affinis]|uniref:Uncharacterized protein n=1 Tax=Aldrovandia affinis TaxID=143900 RepID=A0AAD7WUS3_9TELE|nr:hypothetical protein AAFF_G00240700 [Aldrovandia affinis]